MSSVSNADRSRQDDRIQELREDYENREAENAKRRANDLKRIQKKHDEEVAAVRESFDKRLQDIRDRSRDGFSEKELDHQAEMEEVRSVYRDQLRKKAEENEFNIQEWRKSAESQRKKTAETNETQRNHLTSSHKDELSSRDEQLAKSQESFRKNMQEGLEHNRDTLNRSHSKEREAILSGKQASDDQHRLDVKEMRKAYKDTLKNKDQQMRYKEDYWASRFKDQVDGEDSKKRANGETNDLILQAENRRMQKRYQDALDDRTGMMENGQDNLRNQLFERVNTQLRSKQSEIGRLKNQVSQTTQSERRLREAEKKNLIADYEYKLKLLNEDKDGTVELLKDVNKDRIVKVIDKKDASFRMLDRDHRDRMAHLRTQYREGIENGRQQQDQELDRVKMQSETQVKVAQNTSRKEVDYLKRFQDDTVENLKDTYAERVVEQRERNNAEHANLNRSMAQKFKEIEDKYGAKIDNTVRRYEDKLETMRYNHQKDMVALKNDYEKRLSSREKGSKVEKEGLVQKYEQKLAEVQDQHQQNVEQLKTEHDKEFGNLSKRISYQRKA